MAKPADENLKRLKSIVEDGVPINDLMCEEYLEKHTDFSTQLAMYRAAFTDEFIQQHSGCENFEGLVRMLMKEHVITLAKACGFDTSQWEDGDRGGDDGIDEFLTFVN
ncbi:MAG TPA: hypothetical protein VMM38_09250 [Aridibacter sp.]|nr:hypothetical protein [Aridibacter sp.]